MATLSARKPSSWVQPSAWVLEPEETTFAPTNQWSNKDMDPVSVECRTWSTWSFVAYWLSDATNTAVWMLASSMLAVGLSWKQALPAIAVGHIIIACVLVLNGTIGARLHISFPVIARSSFGFWFSYFAVVSRAILSMFWFGIQTYTGSECVYQMLKAIFGQRAMDRIPNTLSPSANITSVGMMCYLLYWLIQLPLMLVSPQKIRFLFTAKAFVVPAAWFAILIWSVVRVPVSQSLNTRHATLEGPAFSWGWMSALNSALGIYATLAVNIPDFTRYAKNERSQYVQFLIVPTAFTFFGFIGIAVTSAGEVLYGETIWDPLKLIDRWDSRAAAFFASFSFVLATLGTNISANSISAANDLTALCPRYINIRRGQVLCAVIGGWAMCPWEILAQAAGFLSFMNGYTVFLGPFAGIMVVDYWILHRGAVDVPAMYNPKGRYRYIGGVNWRAALAMLVAVPPTFPGLISSINPKIEVGKVKHLFDFAWLFGFFVASSVYWLSSNLFPARETYMDAAITGELSMRDEDAGHLDEKPSRDGSVSQGTEEKRTGEAV